MAAIKGQPSPKPSQLSAPVPQTSVFDAALENEAAAPAASSSVFDAALEEAGPDEIAVASESVQETPSVAAQTLDAAGRVLDYPGGFARAGLANVAGIAQDVAQGKNPFTEKPIVTEEDLSLALRGKGPGFSEYLKRMGVSEGGSLGGVSLRGANGFLLDMASDPFSLVSRTVKSIPYLAKLINKVPEGAALLSPNKVTEALGEAVYKSSVGGLERKAARRIGEEKAAKIGETVLEGIPEEGIPRASIGGEAMLQQRISDISSTFGKMRQGLYDRADELGVSIDTAYPLKNAEDAIATMQKYPGLRASADDMAALLNEYKQQGRVSLQTLSDWKTQLYHSLPKSAWGPHGRLSGPAKTVKAALARDFKEAIVQAGNKAEKGLGDAIEEINGKWGALLDAPKFAGGTGALGQRIDAAVVAGGAAAGGPVGAAKAALANKAYQIATGAGARTAVGRALMEAGKRDLTNRMVRQTVAGIKRPAVVDEVPPEEQ